MNLGIGGHQSAKMKTYHWLTPPDIIKALGPFDLDPCAAPEPRPWPTAETMWSEKDDGFGRKWFGHVWLNPPYGKFTWKWILKLAAHGDGLALIFARTDTPIFHEGIFDRAHGILFIRGRLFFHYPEGARARHNSGAPSVIIAYGSDAADKLRLSGIEGYYAELPADQP